MVGLFFGRDARPELCLLPLGVASQSDADVQTHKPTNAAWRLVKYNYFVHWLCSQHNAQ
jgi:hypothetical protein